MIRDFWVKNYLSIKDRQELSFVAKGPASELVAEIGNGVFLNKLAILYGANASGKSNLLLAIDEVFQLMISSKVNASEKVTGAYPFILTNNEPTLMHISFYAEGIRYDYDVEFNESNILKESMNYYPNGSKTMFYERSFVGNEVQADIKFGPSLKLQAKTQDAIRDNTLNNHSVLSVCNKNSFREDILPFRKVYNYIVKYYHNIDGDNANTIVDELKEVYNDKKRRKFYEIMLKKADLNIVGFEPVLTNRIIPEEFKKSVMQENNIPDAVKETLLNPVWENIFFTNYTAGPYFNVPLEFQSKGTLRFIQILRTLYDLITENHVYLLDELGENLHYDLLLYYLNVFLFNSDKSQLIITSQEAALLGQDMINENRGTVWFVEKNRETASSEYSRGDSFGLHKNLSLYNSYKIGRLGAKPDLGSIFIDLED